MCDQLVPRLQQEEAKQTLSGRTSCYTKVKGKSSSLQVRQIEITTLLNISV